MKILLHPHPTLRTICDPVKKFDIDLSRTIREMFKLMYKANGIGLAAPQVNIPKRFFIINLSNDKDNELVFVNPAIVEGIGVSLDTEQCLSLPGISAPVVRYSKIKIKAYDIKGNMFISDYSALLARAFQHELDHLNGKLIVDDTTQKKPKNQIHQTKLKNDKLD